MALYMRGPSPAFLTSLCCLAIGWTFAASAKSPDILGDVSKRGRPDWEKIRAAEPLDLELRLRLPKASYQVGEPIVATVSAETWTPEGYAIWYQSGGPAEESGLYGTDEAGNPLENPLDWYYSRQGRCVECRSEESQEVMQFKAEVLVNRYLRMDQPGKYVVYVAARFRKGKVSHASDPKGFLMVSDKLTIEISPMASAETDRLAAEAEAGLLADAAKGLKQELVDRLALLGTDKGRALFRRFLAVNTPYTNPPKYPAQTSLARVRDRGAEAEFLLKDVMDKKIPMTDVVQDTYALLAAWPDWTPALSGDLTYVNAGIAREKEAKARIAAAVQSAMAPDDPAVLQTHLTTLIGYGRDHQDAEANQKARAELVKYQLSLTDEQIESLLVHWKTLEGPDFLPVLRKAVQAPMFGEKALRALGKLAPEEARPIFVADLQEATPHFFLGNYSMKSEETIYCLPQQPIPELIPWLRAELAKDEFNYILVMGVLEHYGDPSLMPDLLAFYRRNMHRGEFFEDLRPLVAMIKFWLRHDRERGLRVLQGVIDGAKMFPRDPIHLVFEDEWYPEAEECVAGNMTNANLQVARGAIETLEKYADVKWLEPAIAACEAMADDPSYHVRQDVARKLISSQRWPVDAAQKARLEKIKDAPPMERRK